MHSPHAMPDPHAPSRRHQLALATAAAAGVALCSAIVAGLGADEHWPIDPTIRAALAARGHARTRATLKVLGNAGTAPVYLPATAILATLSAHKRDKSHALVPIGVIAAAAGAALALKHIVRRPRPVGPAGPVNERHSFPSGHTTRATAIALFGGYLLVRERVAPAGVALPVAAAVALSTGASRMYADAHWTTDVIGGWALGAAAAAGGALWYEHLRAESHADG